MLAGGMAMAGVGTFLEDGGAVDADNASVLVVLFIELRHGDEMIKLLLAERHQKE